MKGKLLAIGILIIAAVFVRNNVHAFGLKENFVGGTEFYLDVARDQVKRLSVVHINGRNTAIDTATEDVWNGGGVWAAPTTARTHTITSTQTTDSGAILFTATASGGTATTLKANGADFVTAGVEVGDILVNDTDFSYGIIKTVSATGVTVHDMVRDNFTQENSIEFSNDEDDSFRILGVIGSGAIAVYINGLDANYEEQDEIVKMGGGGTVPTVNTYTMINTMLVIASGSGAGNNGNITATAQTDSTVTARINAGESRTQSAIYQIPASNVGYLNNFHYSMNTRTGTTNSGVTLTLLVKPVGQEWQQRSVLGTFGYNGAFQHNFLGGLTIPSKGTVKIEATSLNNGIDISGGFDIIIENVD